MPIGLNNPGYSSGMLDWNTVSENVLRSTTHALVAGSVNTAINDGSLKDNLGAAVISEGLDLTAAFGNKQVGDLAEYLEVSPGAASKIFMHAVLGGALSSAKGGDFKTGALAGAAAEGLTSVATENLSKYLDAELAMNPQFKVATAQVIGVLAGALSKGDPETGSWVAGDAQRYNDFAHDLGGDWGAAASSLGAYMVEQGKTSDQISDAFRSLGRSDGYQGPGHDYVAGWVLVPGAIGLGVASVELMMGCAFAPLICSQSTIAAAEMAGGDAALGGTALGVFGGGASIVAGDIKAGMGGAGAKVTGGAVELTFDKSTRTWTTPAGLDYGQGSVQGNRVLHVLEHAEPNPAKTTYSVFSMDRKEILGAVDEAWLKKGSPVVGDPGAYVVPMGRTIGTSGETSIKIIVRPGTSQVITAYPVK